MVKDGMNSFGWFRRATLVAAATLGLAGSAVAGKAHEHGLARLDVAVDPARVTIELDAPLEDLLGFERAPRTEAERVKVNAVLTRLRAGDTLFRIDPAAGCTLARATLVSSPLGLGAPPAGSGAAVGDHGDLNAVYEFTCTAGARAGFVEVGLFEAFAGFKRIELQLATPRGQMQATLRRPASRVALLR